MLQTEPRRGAAEGRECTVCPPWVADEGFCAHINGVVLALGRDPAVNRRYLVGGPCKAAEINPEFGYLCGCDDPATFHSDDFETDSLPATEAEFRRREAALLGRAE